MNRSTPVFVFISLIFFTTHLWAGEPIANPEPGISFTFVGEKGENSTAVAWNKKKKLYYAVIGGNEGYPLEVFDESGTPLGQIEAKNDVRGLFCVKKGKRLIGNCVGTQGWIEYRLNKQGMPTYDIERLATGSLQPGFQSVGAFDAKRKDLVFYKDGKLNYYSLKDASFNEQLLLQLPVDEKELNSTTVGYTGEKGFEYVLLDHVRRKLYYFNRLGIFTAEAELPMNAPTHKNFRFSYANGMVFLYNGQARKWIGYRAF